MITYSTVNPASDQMDCEQEYTADPINNQRSSMIENDAYCNIDSSSCVTGSLDDTSIPTTRNEAYTSVSTNTERVDSEETYDYVTNLS